MGDKTILSARKRALQDDLNYSNNQNVYFQNRISDTSVPQYTYSQFPSEYQHGDKSKQRISLIKDCAPMD